MKRLQIASSFPFLPSTFHRRFVMQCLHIKSIKNAYKFLSKIWLLMIIMVGGSLFSEFLWALPTDNDAKSVTFTDPLYEDWVSQKDKVLASQVGTSALFDLYAGKGVIEDICGLVTDWTPGHAYDNHKGWDRNIPNDNSGIYPVFATAPGIVEKIGTDCIKGDTWCNGGMGNFVQIRHNKHVVSKIFHLRYQKVFVSKNQWVDRFHPIGLGGSTGNSTGEHVHIQIEIDGVAVDPISLAEQWSPKIAINLDSCEKNPEHKLVTYQSLYGFVANLFATLSATFDIPGYSQDKTQYWLLDSRGENPKDIILEDYSKEGKKASLVYDLIGHAPQALFLPHVVLKWWFENGSVYLYGKPIAAYPISDISGLTEFDFTNGYLRYMNGPTGLIETFAKYPEEAAPGMFIDGWNAGKSYAFVTAFAKNGGSAKVGYPTSSNGNTPYVHDWSGYSVQVFKGGTLGNSAIVLQNSDDNFQAFLIYGKFWQTYHMSTMGIDVLGPPLGNAYFDPQFNMLRQDFEKGQTILESGEVMQSSTSCPSADNGSMGPTCKCPGSEKSIPCGKCGIQKWSCANFTWKTSGACTDEGLCSINDQETQSCGKCGNGNKSRVCSSQCNWGAWSSCSDPDESKVCCDNAKNACGGCAPLQGQPNASCGNNGHYECNGTEQVFCKEPSEPIVNPPKKPEPPKDPDPKTPPKDPDPTPPPPPSPPTCTPTFESTKVCGSKYCFQITSMDVSSLKATAKLTKITGTAFGNMPLEWDVVNTSTSKILATPGTSCNKLYTGQYEISVTLSLKNVSGKAQAKANFYSGPNCADYETTPTVTLDKCN